MNLSLQKRLAATVIGCSEKRVVFDPGRLEDIKEAITKTDIRLLVGERAIKERPKKSVSRVRANKRRTQKRKGLRKGEGRRKGKITARETKKEAWMKKIRAQRKFIKNLKTRGLIALDVYQGLYTKSKGGFFRSINHIKLYLTEHNMFLKPKAKPAVAAKPKPKKVQEKKEKTPEKPEGASTKKGDRK